MAKSSRAMCGGDILFSRFLIKINSDYCTNILQHPEIVWGIFFLAQFNFCFVVVWLPLSQWFFPNVFAQNDKKNGFHDDAFYHFLALQVRHQSNGDESVLERELMFDFLVWYIKKERYTQKCRKESWVSHSLTS